MTLVASRCFQPSCVDEIRAREVEKRGADGGGEQVRRGRTEQKGRKEVIVEEAMRSAGEKEEGDGGGRV